jgi:hypothetical protein
LCRPHMANTLSRALASPAFFHANVIRARARLLALH